MKRKILMILIVLVLLAYTPQLFSQEVTLETVNQTLIALQSQISSILGEGEGRNLQTILDRLSSIEEKLDTLTSNTGKLERIDTRLTNLNSTVEELNRSLREMRTFSKAAENIPEVQDIAEIVGKMDKLGELITAALEELERPTEEAVSNTKEIVGKVKKVMESVIAIAVLIDFSEKIEGWVKDIFESSDDNSYPLPAPGYYSSSSNNNSSYYKCINDQLINLKNDYIPLLKAYKTLLVKINTPVKDIENKIPEIDKISKDLEKVLKPVDKFNKDLKPLRKKLKKMDRLLRKKIDFKFKVKIMGVTYKHHFHIISVKEALKGVDHIEKMMADLLPNDIYLALKAFGLKKAAKKIHEMAEHPFRLLLKDIKILIKKVKIPGVSDLEKTFDETKEKMDSFENKLTDIYHLGIPDVDVDLYKSMVEKRADYLIEKCKN